MHRIDKLITHVSTALSAVAAGCLVLLMLLTFFDVVGRYFFNAPITFTVELTELAMGLVVFLGLGLTTLKGGHITVDVLTRIMPGWLFGLVTVLAKLFTVGFLAVVTWQLFAQTNLIRGDGLITQVLGIQVYPFALVMTGGAAFAVIVALWALIRRRKDDAA